ncbi:MAG: FAD binding domain-containing protein [Desulfatibacillaceae bacterium]
MLPQFSYIRPKTLADAVGHLRQDGAAVHAGGTDLLGCLRERTMNVSKVVSISGLSDLSGVSENTEGGLSIGALTTITEVSENELIKKKYPGLAQAASEVASPQLRNQGTIGGNLCQKPRCWYYRGEFHCLRKGGDTCYAIGGENQFHAIFGHEGICAITHPSDTAPMLAALDARVRVEGPKGRRGIRVSELHVPPGVDPTAETYLKPGEVITAINIPAPGPGLYTSYRKVRARRSWDFALSGVALALAMNGGKVTSGKVYLSGAAPVPWRSQATEQAILGKSLDEKTIQDASRAVVEGAKPLSQNRYKLDLFTGTMAEELEKAAG